MLSGNENTPSMQKGNFFKAALSPKGMIGDPQEHNPIFAGWGACKSCGCSGYIQGGAGYQSCKTCGHHFSQHR